LEIGVVKDVFEDAYNYMKSGQLMRQVVNKISAVDFNNLAERQHFGDIYEQILNDLQSAGNAGEYYTPRAVTAFMVDRIDPRPGEILLDPKKRARWQRMRPPAPRSSTIGARTALRSMKW
jgi:type I restriction enzyme M protein